jgi:hypothetical protein
MISRCVEIAPMEPGTAVPRSGHGGWMHEHRTADCHARYAYGGLPKKPSEIAIVSRSPVRMLVDFACCISVPVADTAEDRVFTPEPSTEQQRSFRPLARERTSEARR